MTPEEADELIAIEGAGSPAVVTLARALALAVRVETELVRAMRLALCPGVEAGAEADLFFSDLVDTRDAGGLTLVPEVRARLCGRLAEDPQELERAWVVLRDMHQDQDPAIGLEESATYHALRGDQRSFLEMQRALSGIAKGLRDSPDAHTARWALRALPRLPRRARDSDAGRFVADLARDAQTADGTARTTTTVPPWAERKVVMLGFEFSALGARIGTPPQEGAVAFELPGQLPLELEVGWPDASGWETVAVTVGAQRARVHVQDLPPGLVRLRTAAGDEVRLRPRGPFPELEPQLRFLRRGEDEGEALALLRRELEDLQWHLLDREPAADARQAPTAQVPQHALVTWLDFDRPSTLQDWLSHSDASSPDAALLRAIGESGGAAIVRCAGHVERIDTAVLEDPDADLMQVLRGLAAASETAALPSLERWVRETLIEIERDAVERWQDASDPGSAPSRDPVHAMVLQRWADWRPGGGEPIRFQEYRSAHRRLADLAGDGGTIWAVTGRDVRGRGRRYQLAYRLERVRTQATDGPSARYILRVPSPADATHFPQHDATEMLLGLAFTSGAPMREPGAIGRRLQSMAQLTVADVERVEDFAADLLHSPELELTATLRHRFDGHAGTVRSIAISADATLAATAGNSMSDQTVRVWDLATGAAVKVIEHAAEEGGATPLALSSGEHTLAFGRGSRVHPYRLDAQAGEEPIALPDRVSSLAWRSERELVAGTAAGEVLVLDTGSGSFTSLVQPGGEPVSRLDLDASGRRLAICWSTRLEIWDLRASRRIGAADLAAGEGAPAFQRPPLDLRSTEVWFDTPVKRYRLARGEPDPPLSLPGPVAAVAAGRAVVVEDGSTLIVHDLGSDRQLARVATGAAAFSAIALARDASCLVAADLDHRVWVWDLPRRARSRTEDAGASAAAQQGPADDEPERTRVSARMARKHDQNTVPVPGLYRCRGSERFEQIPVTPEELTTSAPILLLIPGLASNVEAIFAGLWNDPSSGAFTRGLEARFRDQIIAYDYWSLSRHPFANALELVRQLPHGASLVIIGYSTGGLLGELLCRSHVRGRKEPFDEQEIEWFRDVPGVRDMLVELSDQLRDKRLSVERFVAIATPFRGSTLFVRSKRLLDLMPGLIQAIGIGGAFLASAGVAALLRTLDSPTSVPGLEAILPDSPFIRLINDPTAEVESDLSVITGDVEASGILARLRTLAMDRLLGEDNDLIVPTASMVGGAPRTRPGRVAAFRGPEINHFSYLSTPRVLQAIGDALESRDATGIWTPIGESIGVPR